MEDDQITSTIDTACKIIRSNNYCIAFTGRVRPIPGCFVYDIAESAFQKHNFSKAIEVINQQFEVIFEKYGRGKDSTDIDFYKKSSFPNSVVALRMYVISNYKNTLSAELFGYNYTRIKNKPQILIHREILSQKLKNGEVYSHGLAKLNNFQKDYFEKNIEKNDTNTVKEVIQMVSNDHSLTVGGVVNLLEIRRDTIKWLINSTCD